MNILKNYSLSYPLFSPSAPLSFITSSPHTMLLPTILLPPILPHLEMLSSPIVACPSRSPFSPSPSPSSSPLFWNHQAMSQVQGQDQVHRFKVQVIVISRPTHLPINRRWRSFSGGRVTRIERSASAAPSLTVFRNRLKTHLFSVSFP